MTRLGEPLNEVFWDKMIRDVRCWSIMKGRYEISDFFWKDLALDLRRKIMEKLDF